MVLPPAFRSAPGSGVTTASATRKAAQFRIRMFPPDNRSLTVAGRSYYSATGRGRKGRLVAATGLKLQPHPHFDQPRAALVVAEETVLAGDHAGLRGRRNIA